MTSLRGMTATVVTDVGAVLVRPATAEEAAVEEVLVATTRSTPTRPAATIVSESARAPMTAVATAATTEPTPAEESGTTGATHTLDVTVPAATATATTTAAIDATEVTGTRGAQTVLMVEIAGGADATEASAVDAIAVASKRKNLLHPTSRARLPPTSPASSTSRSASVA